jgi:hypothetical protein
MQERWALRALAHIHYPGRLEAAYSNGDYYHHLSNSPKDCSLARDIEQVDYRKWS